MKLTALIRPAAAKLAVALLAFTCLTPAKAADTATWTGATDSDWHTASNWSTGAVPDANVEVSIPANTSVIIGANTTATSGKLTVNGTLDIKGTLNSSTATPTFNGSSNVTIEKGASWIVPTGGVVVHGNLTVNGTIRDESSNVGKIYSNLGTAVITAASADACRLGNAANWRGTYVINWSPTGAFNLNNYGNHKDNVVVLGADLGSEGYFTEGQTIAPVIRLDADVTIKNGSGRVEAKKTEKLVTFTKLTGNHKLTTFATSNYNAWIWYKILTLDQFEGSLCLSRNTKVEIDVVNVAAEPANGTCVIPATVGQDAAIYGNLKLYVNNADTGKVLTLGSDGLYAPIELAITPVDNASVSLATVNGDAVDASSGKITVKVGDQVVVTYTANEGYEVSNGTVNMTVAGGTTSVDTSTVLVKPYIAQIGSTNYVSLVTALGEATAGQTVTLLANNAEAAITIPANVTVATAGYSISGTIAGDGNINATADFTPTFGEWTGTFAICWNPDSSTTHLVLNKYGNADSKVEIKGVNGAFIALPSTGNAAPTVNPEIVLTANWTVNDGWDNATTTFKKLSGAGILTINGSGLGTTAIPYTIEVLNGFTGTLAGVRGQYTIGDIVTANDGYGTCLVKCVASKEPVLTNTKVNGSAATLCVDTINNQRGIYRAEAKIGNVPYSTLAGAVAALQGSQTVTLLANSNENVLLPAGCTLDATGVSYTGKVTTVATYKVTEENGVYTSVQDLVTFTVAVPANTTATVNGVVIPTGNANEYTCINGTPVTITYTANDGYVVKNGSQQLTVTSDTQSPIAAPQGMTVNPAVAQVVGGAKYELLQEALDAVQNGQTITVLQDITETAYATAQYAYTEYTDKSFTIDFNGKTVTTAASPVPSRTVFNFVNKGSVARTVTLTNGTITAVSGTYNCVRSQGSESEDDKGLSDANAPAAQTINIHGMTLNNNRSYGVAIKPYRNTTVDLATTTINSNIGGNVDVQKDSKVIIHSGTYTQTGGAGVTGDSDTCRVNISVSYGGEAEILGGTFTSSWYGFEVCSSGGTITISDATATAGGYVLRTTGGAGVIEVAGGKFSGAYASTTGDTIAISGGVFGTEVPAEYCAEGYVCEANTGATAATYPYAVVEYVPVVTFQMTDSVGKIVIQNLDDNVHHNVFDTWNDGVNNRPNIRVAFTQTVELGGTATKPTNTPYYDYNITQPNNGNPKTFTNADSHAYTFDGWATSDGALYDFTTPVTADLPLHPRFSATGATILINNETELRAFAREVELGRKFREQWGEEKQTVKLANDITLTGSWTPVAGFEGIFDGDNHSISGLVISATGDNAGFFSGLNSHTVVKDLTFVSPTVTSTDEYVGVLAGSASSNSSTIHPQVSNVNVTGAFSVSGENNVGALIGQVNAGVQIEDCTIAGTGATVTATGSDGRCVGGLLANTIGAVSVTDCSVSGVTVTGYRKIGGLIGQVQGNLTCTDASVSNVTLHTNASSDYSKALTMGGFVGIFPDSYSGSTVSGTVSDITMTGPANIAEGKTYVMGLVSGGTGDAVTTAETKMSSMTFDVTVSGTNTRTIETATNYAGINGNPSVTYVAQIGDDKYETLQEAIAAANASAATTITLLTDVTLTETIEINRPSATGATKALTFDLNGHNITATDCRALWVKIGYVKVDGSGTVSSVKTSGSAFSADSSVVRVGWVTESPVNGKTATFELGADATVSTDYCYGVTVFGNNKALMTSLAGQTFRCSGTVAVTGTVPAVSGNGTSTLTRADITINEGATVSATSDYAIYFPQRGYLTVNGTVIGQGGIEMKAGKLVTSETTVITATGTPSHPGVNNNGTSTSGYAVAFVENDEYYGYKSLGTSIAAGTFNGAVALLRDNALDSTKENSIVISGGTFGSIAKDDGAISTIAVSGGTFDTAVPANCCADHYEPTGADETPGKYTVQVKASDAAASITKNDKTAYYLTINDAITAATAGDTVKLEQDSTSSNYIYISKAITFDLNGHDITSSNATAGVVIGAAGITLTDSSENPGAITTTATAASAVYLNSNCSVTIDTITVSSQNIGVKNNRGTVTVNGGTIAGKNGIAIYGNGTAGSATLTVNGGTITGTNLAITGNGTANEGGTVITINGGSISVADDVAIYQPQSGTLTVTGGTITGATAIYQKCGTLDITGGTITGTGVAAEYVYNGSGANATGDAIVIDNCAFPGGAPSAQIKDATIASDNGRQIGYFVYEDSAEGTVLAGSRYTLNTNDERTWLADSSVAGYGYKIGETVYMAQIGTTKYETLAEAVDAVAANGKETTIKLLMDTTGSGVIVAAGKNIVFDLNGHTYTVVAPTVGSSGTETNAFQLLAGSTVTFKNGRLESAVAKIFLQNYSNLTLDGVVINKSKNAQMQYAVSNNNGSMTATGATEIYGSAGQVAFDICANTFYPDGVSVKFDAGFTGKVEGTIEYGVWGGVPATNKATLGIAAGTFDIAWSVDERLENDAKTNLNVAGGSFNIAVPSDYCALSCTPCDLDGGRYGVTIAGTYEVEVPVAVEADTQAAAEAIAEAASTEAIKLPAEVAAELKTEAEVTQYKEAFEYKVVESTTTVGTYDVVATLKDTVKPVSTDSTMEEKTEIEIETIPGLYYSVETSDNVGFEGSTTQELAPEMATAGTKKLDISGIEPEENETVKYFKVVTTATSNGSAVAKKESKTFGVMKTATPATKLAIIAVPWQDAAATSDTGTVKVSSMIKTEELAEGTKIHVANGASGYNTWKLQGGKWVDLNAVVATTPGQEAEAEAGVDASAINVPQGGAFWVEQENPKPIVMIGQVGDQPTTKMVTRGSNLCASPKGEAFDLNKITTATESDTIVVPVNSGEAAKIFQRKGGKWKYWKFTNGRGAWVEEDTEIPAGTGFWYNRTGSSTTIDWNAK